MNDNIYLIKDNEYLDLDNDISIQFNWNSPLFDSEVLKGSYSYPFKLSLKSNKNRRLLLRPDDIKNTQRINRRIDITMILFGIEYNCYLKMNYAARADSADVTIFIKDTVLVESKEKSIREFDYGTIDLRLTGQYKRCEFYFNQSPPTSLSNGRAYISINGYKYTAVQANPQWANLTDPQKIDALNSLISQINADTDRNKCTASLSSYISLPTIILTAAIEGKLAPFVFTEGYAEQPYNNVAAVFLSFEYLGSGSEISDFMKDTVFGLNSEKRITFAPMIFDSFYENEDIDFNGVANFFKKEDNTFISNDFQHTNQQSVIPLVYLNHVVTQLFKNLGYKVSGNFLKNSDINKIVFFNTKTLDYRITESHYGFVVVPPYGSVNRIVNYDVNVFNDHITVADHLPDITISKLIALLRNTLGATFIFDSSTKTLDLNLLDNVIRDFKKIYWNGKSISSEKISVNDVEGFKFEYTNDGADSNLSELIKSTDGLAVKDAVATFADLPTIGNEVNDLRLVIADQAYYQASYTDSYGTVTWNWNFYSANLFDYNYKNPTEEISSGNSCYLMAKDDNEQPVPYLKQKAISEAYNQPARNFTPRLMIYRGLRNYTLSGTDYVYPSLERNASITETLDMQWDGDKGLFNTFFKKWSDFKINANVVEKMLDLKQSDLNSIKWDHFYVIEDVPYLIESVVFTVFKKGISTVKASLLSK